MSEPGEEEPDGATALARTLLDAGVEVCFANPGTSELHFVAALDPVGGPRPVLGLFEGVVTGAADGYARMAGRPAAALLHLGPGLGNGLANLHNAGKAHTPVVAVVGDHAVAHKHLDPPLESDLDGIAGAVSGWVRRCRRPQEVGKVAAAAVAAACGPPGRVATVILPADVAWGPGGRSAPAAPAAPPAPVPDQALRQAVDALRSGEPTALLVGGPVAASPVALAAAAAVADATGATLLCETFPPRLARGAGRPPLGRLAYLTEAALGQLAGHRHLVLAGAGRPVAFFASPGLPGDLVPEGCSLHRLAGPGDDAVGALLAVAGELTVAGGPGTGPAGRARRPVPARSTPPAGPLDAEAVMAAVGAALPEDAVVVDESVSSSAGLGRALAGAPPHDLLTLPGGAIGWGLPAAAGAAVGAPGRPVVCLEADGSAMYTISALWTQAREGLDVTTVVLDNRAYAILRFEFERLGLGVPGPVAAGLLDLRRPELDFVALAAGLGVPAVRVRTGEELSAALSTAFAEPGPHLVDALIA